MQRAWLIGCVVLSVLGGAGLEGAESAASSRKTYHPADKFVRGLVNIVTAPLELPRRLRQRTQGDNTVRGWTLGTTQGLGYVVVRFVAGTYEVLTFPAPAPRHYTPVLEPEYVWDELPPK